MARLLKRIATHRLLLALTTLAFAVLAAPALVSVTGAGEGPARESATSVERLVCETEGERLAEGDDAPPQYLLAPTAIASTPDLFGASTLLPPGGIHLRSERLWPSAPARAPPV